MVLCGLTMGWLLQHVVLHIVRSGELYHRGRSYIILVRSQPQPSVSWVNVAGLQCCLVLALTILGPPTLFQVSKEESLPSPMQTTWLDQHDDGLHACDAAVEEDLCVWDHVFPCDFTDLWEEVHVELFQLLEKKVLHGPRL